jgi:hypothetical protein
LENFKETDHNETKEKEQGLTIVEGNDESLKTLAVEDNALILQPSFDLDSPKFITDETGIFSSVLQLSFDVEVDDGSEDIFE